MQANSSLSFCKRCECFFLDEEALKQHRKNLKHGPYCDCQECLINHSCEKRQQPKNVDEGNCRNVTGQVYSCTICKAGTADYFEINDLKLHFSENHEFKQKLVEKTGQHGGKLFKIR